MDAEFRSWAQKQDAAMAAVLAEQKRQGDQQLLLIHEVASIVMMLAPKISEGPSPLEQLLAQIVAQNQEAVALLRDLVQQGNRIEGKLGGPASVPPPPINGHGRATRQ